MMKKIQIVLCALLICTVWAFAAETTISAEAGSLTAEKTIPVSVQIDKNTGVSGWKIVLTWDDEALSIDEESVTCGEMFSNGMFICNTSEAGKISAIWANATESSDNGELFTFALKVKDSASGETYPITVSAANLTDENGGAISTLTSDAIVTIPKQKTDDVSGGDTPKDSWWKRIIDSGRQRVDDTVSNPDDTSYTADEIMPQSGEKSFNASMNGKTDEQRTEPSSGGKGSTVPIIEKVKDLFRGKDRGIEKQASELPLDTKLQNDEPNLKEQRIENSENEAEGLQDRSRMPILGIAAVVVVVGIVAYIFRKRKSKGEKR